MLFRKKLLIKILQHVKKLGKLARFRIRNFDLIYKCFNLYYIIRLIQCCLILW